MKKENKQTKSKLESLSFSLFFALSCLFWRFVSSLQFYAMAADRAAAFKAALGQLNSQFAR